MEKLTKNNKAILVLKYSSSHHPLTPYQLCQNLHKRILQSIKRKAVLMMKEETFKANFINVV